MMHKIPLRILCCIGSDSFALVRVSSSIQEGRCLSGAVSPTQMRHPLLCNFETTSVLLGAILCLWWLETGANII